MIDLLVDVAILTVVLGTVEWIVHRVPFMNPHPWCECKKH